MKRAALIFAIFILSTSAFTQVSVEAAELTDKGIKYYEAGNLGLALDTLTKAIELSSKPKYRKPTRSNLTEGGEDAELRDRITFHDPVTAVAFLNRGHVHFARAKMDLAIADYSQSIKLKPANAEALASRSTAHLMAGQLTQAVDDARRAIKVDPTNPRGHLALTMVFQEQGRTVEALASVNKAVELDPKNAEVFFRRGDLHRLELRYAAAMADFDRASALDGNLPGPYTGRGAIRFEQARYRESVEHYTTALKLDPRLLQARRFRGYSYLAMGMDDEAKRDFERVLSVAPMFREEIERATAQILKNRKL